MAFTLYKEIKYALAGIPSANLPDYVKLYKITTDADIAAELAGGGGIKLTSADGSTDIPFGLLPQTNLAAGTVHFYTKVSLLTGASVGDVVARIYYDAGETTTEDKSGVVTDGYIIFTTLEEDPSNSAPQIRDWVTDTLIGSAWGSMASGDSVAAVVGNGLDFNGGGQYVAFPAMVGPSQCTIDFWAKPNASAVQVLSAMYDQDNAYYQVYTVGTDLHFRIVQAKDSNYIGRATSSGALSTSAFRLCHFVWTGGIDPAASCFILVDGVELQNSGDSAGSFTGSNTNSVEPWIAAQNSSWSGAPVVSLPFGGVIDEFRIADAVRTIEFCEYQFIDQSDNSDTFTLSAEQGGGGGGNIAITPAASETKTATVNPTVILGSLAITPAASSARTSTVNPAVTLGSLAITPSASNTRTSTEGPTVLAGGLVFTPAASSVRTSTVDPTVILGSLAITPAASSARTSTVNPLLFFSSMAFTPAPSNTRTSTSGPNVVIGSGVTTNVLELTVRITRTLNLTTRITRTLEP